MAYNQVKLDPSCYHYQIYLWKPDLDPSQPVVVMVVRTLIYGVKSSGNQLFSGFGKVADYAIEHFPEHTPGAETLKDDGYVDDIIHCDEDNKTARSTANSLNFVLSESLHFLWICSEPGGFQGWSTCWIGWDALGFRT